MLARIRFYIINWLVRRLLQFDEPAKLLLNLPPEQYQAVDRMRDFKRVFETPEGERVLAQIMRWAKLWHTSMSANAVEMAFAEGERNIGLKILAAMCYQEKPTKQTESPKGE